jgi:hypothetical protein
MAMVEWLGYWLVRGGLVLGGLTAILATISGVFVFPEPNDSEPIRTLAIGFAIAALMIFPHRWTMAWYLFWPRLLFAVALGVWFVLNGLWGIGAGLMGRRDPAIYLASLGFIFVGVALPISLCWRKRRLRL